MLVLQFWWVGEIFVLAQAFYLNVRRYRAWCQHLFFLDFLHSIPHTLWPLWFILLLVKLYPTFYLFQLLFWNILTSLVLKCTTVGKTFWVALFFGEFGRTVSHWLLWFSLLIKFLWWFLFWGLAFPSIIFMYFFDFLFVISEKSWFWLFFQAFVWNWATLNSMKH